MTAQFDPLDYAQQLETAGVPKAQAQVHARTLAHVINDCVAVPADLASLKRELTLLISETEARLRVEIARVENVLRAEIQAVEARLTSKLEIVEARLNGKIDALRQELRFHRWVNGITLALVVGMFLRSWLP